MKGKVGRNDPCPCGSGKKYKNCCLKKETHAGIQFLDPLITLRTCAWCGKEIPEDSEIFSLSARARAGKNIEQFAGKAFYIHLLWTPRSIAVVIPTNESQAKKEGKDMLFSICSESCGRELKTALNKEIDIIASLN